MTEGKRAGLSKAQRAALWHRWKAGESLYEIGRALGKEHALLSRPQQSPSHNVFTQGTRPPRIK
jgi:hypothetical protein